MISDITNIDEITSEQLGHNEITQIGVQGQPFSSIKLAQNVSEHHVIMQSIYCLLRPPHSHS